MNVDQRYGSTPNSERTLANFAHELRNPLAGVRAAIQIVYARLPSSQEQDMLRDALLRLADVEAMIEALVDDAATLTSDASHGSTLTPNLVGDMRDATSVDNATSSSGVRKLATEISTATAKKSARERER